MIGWAPVNISLVVASFGLAAAATSHIFHRFNARAYHEKIPRHTSDNKIDTMPSTHQPQITQFMETQESMSAEDVDTFFNDIMIRYQHHNESAQALKAALTEAIQQARDLLKFRSYKQDFVDIEEQVAFIKILKQCIDLNSEKCFSEFSYSDEDFEEEVALAKKCANMAYELREQLSERWTQRMRPYIHALGPAFKKYFEYREQQLGKSESFVNPITTDVNSTSDLSKLAKSRPITH